MVKNPACHSGDTGSIPGQGTNVPRASEQLSLHTPNRKSVHHKENPA